MTDETARELLAAFVQVLESLERTNDRVRALLTAAEAGRRPDPDAARQYHEQCNAVEERVMKLRSMLATLSRDL
jgi:hypothetical protein